MSNAFVMIKLCYVHNQWYDILCATLYFSWADQVTLQFCCQRLLFVAICVQPADTSGNLTLSGTDCFTACCSVKTESRILLYETLDHSKKISHNENILEPVACVFRIHVYLYHNWEDYELRLEVCGGLLIALSQGHLLNRTTLFQFCDGRSLCKAGYGCSFSSSCSWCCADDGYGCSPLTVSRFPFSPLSHDCMLQSLCIIISVS